MAYKRRFSDDDAELMEEDAKAASRMTAAERQMALSRNFDNRRNNEIADLQAAARERHLASRAHFVTMNPGAVSPQERAAIAQERLTGHEKALQEHEMNMLKQRGENDKDVAHEKRMGMENQGVAVGQLKYGYTDYNGLHEGSEERIARQQGQNALSLEEKKLAGQKDLAGIGLKQHELEWGKGGGRERVAEIEGKSKVGAAEAQARAQAEIQAQKQALEQQKLEAQKQKNAEQLAYKYASLNEQERKNVDDAADRLVKSSNGRLSPQDARFQVMAGREQGGKKEVKRQRNPKTGQVRIVYDDGSTEIVNE